MDFYTWWGEKEPLEQHKFSAGSGISFCGCQKNIHAVTGVKSGFRLVLLVWTRPVGVVVPEDQKHVCYFRPGTGSSVWLTTADLEHYPARRRRKEQMSWVPTVNESDLSEESCGMEERGEE